VLHARPSRPPYFSSDVAFPSPFVLHTRPSHPPYNCSNDFASPSPVVLLARPSRPPYFSSDVAFPSPFVLHTRPSHPPYNCSNDLASPSPVVLLARPSPPPSVLMSHFHPHSCYIPRHLIYLTTSVPISCRLPHSPVGIQTALVFLAVATENC